MFSKSFDRRVYTALCVVLLSGVILVSFGAFVLWPSNREAGYMPEQPIDYSHKLHAGELKIECLYCHTNATKGPNATVPPVSTCMNCHSEVQPKGTDGKVKPEIQKLLNHWNGKSPIEWNKVHDIADFAYFDHSRHMAAGLECQDCHGDIEKMTHMRRKEGMKMSWCLDCHKEEKEVIAPNGKILRQTRAPINCSTCHR